MAGNWRTRVTISESHSKIKLSKLSFVLSPLWANPRAIIEAAKKRTETKKMQIIRMAFMLVIGFNAIS
jgi:hypothetical protein